MLTRQIFSVGTSIDRTATSPAFLLLPCCRRPQIHGLSWVACPPLFTGLRFVFYLGTLWIGHSVSSYRFCPSWSAWLFVILRGGVFVFTLRGTTWSLDLRSNRKTVFEHSITFYLMVNRGANTKSDSLPGSTGEPARPRKQLQLTAAVTTVLMNSK